MQGVFWGVGWKKKRGVLVAVLTIVRTHCAFWQKIALNSNFGGHFQGGKLLISESNIFMFDLLFYEVGLNNSNLRQVRFQDRQIFICLVIVAKYPSKYPKS